MTKTNSIAFACATVLAAAIAMPAAAHEPDKSNKQAQAGGAAGLVGAVVQLAANDVADVKVVDSLNNLVAVENVLNNSPILSGNDTEVTVGDISLLDGLDVDLNALGITVDEVTGVVLATTGTVTDVLVLR
ncbi:hypothetical protein [Lysobacter sp. A3-1-A15]|uniref:hypothetical protein n=1 Tax=Novilysobacter viscosus TaxID=3098602 RepID=UPI002ED87A9B